MATGHFPVGTSPAAATKTAPETLQAPSSSFDERWQAWQAKGEAHDRAVRRKLTIAAPSVAIVAAIIFYTLFVR